MEKNTRWIYYFPIAITYATHWMVIAALTLFKDTVYHRLFAIGGFCLNGLTALFTHSIAKLFGSLAESPNMVAWAVVTLIYYIVFYLPLLGFCTTKERNNKLFFIFLQLIFIGLHLAASINLLPDTDLLLSAK